MSILTFFKSSNSIFFRIISFSTSKTFLLNLFLSNTPSIANSSILFFLSSSIFSWSNFAISTLSSNSEENHFIPTEASITNKYISLPVNMPTFATTRYIAHKNH